MSESETKLIPCPFCAEGDFDLLGLKMHLRGFCAVYESMDVQAMLAKERIINTNV